MLRKLWAKVKAIWQLARSERASPREIGWAFGIGAFLACTPAMGFHGWLALGAATVLKKNRLFAWLGSRISNMLILPFIVIAEVQVAHRLRAGEWLVLDRGTVIHQAPSLILDWCIGSIPVGGAIGILLGLLAWAIATHRQRRASPAPPAEG